MPSGCGERVFYKSWKTTERTMKNSLKKEENIYLGGDPYFGGGKEEGRPGSAKKSPTPTRKISSAREKGGTLSIMGGGGR